MSNDYVWSDNLQRGVNAQTLVETLFKKSGNKVLPYGLEKTLREIADLDKRGTANRSPYHRRVYDIIRNTPDFVVIDREGNFYFVEVKFIGDSTHGILSRVKGVQENWPTWVIIVRRDEKPFFLAFPPKELSQQAKDEPLPLEKVREWNIDMVFYKWCEMLVDKFYPTMEELKELNKLSRNPEVGRKI